MSASGSVDERVVSMEFQNSDFLRNVSQTISALAKLKEALSFKGAKDGLDEVSQSASRFNLSNMANAADNVASHFNAMRVVAYTAIANITSRAVNAGIALIKGLTITPILDGLSVYETKINAIQTILANTQAQGTTLTQVTAALKELNTYANQTVFSFADMAKNIGTFTAAGVNLTTSVASIKGIANLAALSGASAEQASSAMYQLSQAIASGTVKLQDWNSVVNAGLGGKTFQTALVNTARATGVNIDAIIKKAGSFRNSLQEGWLTSNILTKTLSQFTGDLSLAQIKAMGFTDKEAAAILRMGKTAVASAVNIRTITQLMAALHEEVGTAWSTVWETLIGNITQATSLLTKVHVVLENFFTKPIYDLNTFLQEFVKLGGVDQIIQIIKDSLTVLHNVLKPIGEAWKSVFPPFTVQTLIAIVNAIQHFVQGLIASGATMAKIKSIFTGVFSILKIGIDIITGAFHALTGIAGAAKGGGEGLLTFGARVGDAVNNFRKFIESSGAITKFFNILSKILAVPVRLIGLAAQALGNLAGVAAKAKAILQPFAEKVGQAFTTLGSGLAKAISSGDFSAILTIVNQVLLGGVLVSIRKFFTGLGKVGPKKSLLDTIKESFEGLTKTLTAMQTNLKSGTLLKIAAAIGIMTASMVALSVINTGNLAKALTAMAVMFTQLLVAMGIVSRIAGLDGIVKMGVIAASLNLLATSVLILSGAVAILAQFSWEQLAKGLGAVAILLASIAGFSILVSKNAKGMLAAGYSMQSIAVALNVLSLAVARLGKLDIPTLAKGVGTIATLLLVIAGFEKIGGGKQLIASAASMILIGAALNVVAVAVNTLGSLSIGTLAKGLVSIAAALVIIAIAMAAMPPSMITTAIGLDLVSVALLGIGQALANMGGMSWSEIAKGLVTLAGALVLIAAASIAMTGALPGAAAIFIVAGALAVMTPVLIGLASLPWEGIAKAMVALAGTFVIFAAASLLLIPVIPAMLLLAAAIGILGAGMLAAGVGVAAFGVGLTAIALSGGAAIGVLIGGVKQIIGLIPLAASAIGQGLINIANIIGKGGPAIVNAIAALLTALLNAIIRVVPLAVRAFTTLVTGMLTALQNNAPRIVNALAAMVIQMLNILASKAGAFATAASNLMVNFLNGIARNVGRVITAGANIAISFINGIGSNILRITQAGINMVIHLINGLASQIRASTPELRSAGLNLGLAIIDGMTFGLASAAGGLLSKARGIAGQALSIIGSVLHIGSPSKETFKYGAWVVQGLVLGLLSWVNKAKDASTQVAASTLGALQGSLTEIGSLVQDNIEVQPKITPVVDLTQARAGFNALSGLSKDQIIAGVSTNKATAISAEALAAAANLNATSALNAPAVQFIQNNTSPAALSTAEIYRQTKNQLSVVKGALPTSAKQS